MTCMNALSVDLEDWCQSTFDRSKPISRRVVDNTMRLLDLLDRWNAKATFFVLGRVAEVYPELVMEVHRRGHEIASHGYSHTPIFLQTPGQFAADVERSISLLESMTSCKVIGYRAPDFSITRQTLWALQVLEESDILYDSSIFPILHWGYGISYWPRGPHQVHMKGIKRFIEFPISTLKILGVNVPFVGGGYTRLCPTFILERGISSLNRQGLPAVIYLHPYEIDLDEFDSLNNEIPFRLRFHQGLNRRKVLPKLENLMQEFRFASMGELLRSLGFLSREEVNCYISKGA